MINPEALRAYQKELEIANENKPKGDKIVEWALIEIAIQLTGICSSLHQISIKTN